MTQAEAIKEVREDFARVGHSLDHMTDEELIAAVDRLRPALWNAGLSVDQFFRAAQALSTHRQRN